MGETAGVALAVLHASAAGRIHGLVDGADDLHYGDVVRRTAEPVTTPRPTGAAYQPALAQVGEQLLQIGQ